MEKRMVVMMEPSSVVNLEKRMAAWKAKMRAGQTDSHSAVSLEPSMAGCLDCLTVDLMGPRWAALKVHRMVDCLVSPTVVKRADNLVANLVYLRAAHLVSPKAGNLD